MLAYSSHIVNATLFGALAAVAFMPGPGHRSLRPATGIHPLAAATAPIPRPGAPFSASNPRLPQVAQLAAGSNGGGAGGSSVVVTVPNAPYGPQAIVPPIARTRPKPGQLSIEIVPPASDAKGSAAKKATKLAAAGAKPGQPADRAGKAPLDTSTRSALGASPGNGLKCNTGFRYDAKQLKCVAQPTPAKAKAAATAPAPQPAKALPR